MAIAKTPKTTTAAAKPAAAKPAVAAKKPAVSKPAAAAKAPEEAVVHSAEVAAETTAQVAESVTASAEKTVETATAEIVEAAAKTPAAKASTAIVKQAKVAGDEMLSRGVTPLLDFSRENAILMVSTGNEFALGLHKLSLSLLDWSAESCDKSVAAGQKMLSAKTVEEVMDLSQSLATDGFKQILKEGSELSALSTKLFEDTLVALPGRFAANVEKLASHAA